MCNELTRNPIVRLEYCMHIDYGGRSEGIMIMYMIEWSMDDEWMGGSQTIHHECITNAMGV